MWIPSGSVPLVAALALLAGADTGRAAARAYVSNEGGGITVIDLATLATVAQIDPGAAIPRGIGITDDGALLVTANRGGSNLSVIERESGKLLRQVPIGENPEFVRVRGRTAYVSFEPAAEGGPPPRPGSAEARELARRREAEGAEPARIAVVDLDAGRVVRNIVCGIETEGIEFSADGEKLLVTNEAEDTITVHEIATGAQVARIDTSPYGPRPRGIKRAPDGSRYVATLEFGNKLLVLDGRFAVVREVPTGEVPNGVAFDRAGLRLFVALSRGRALEVFDASSFTPVRRVATGDRCWHFSFTPDDRRILVACGRSDELVVIDAQTFAEVRRIGDLARPWGVVTWPKSVGTLDAP